jgi:hypothetical protein
MIVFSSAITVARRFCNSGVVSLQVNVLLNESIIRRLKDAYVYTRIGRLKVPGALTLHFVRCRQITRPAFELILRRDEGGDASVVMINCCLYIAWSTCNSFRGKTIVKKFICHIVSQILPRLLHAIGCRKLCLCLHRWQNLGHREWI